MLCNRSRTETAVDKCSAKVNAGTAQTDSAADNCCRRTNTRSFKKLAGAVNMDWKTQSWYQLLTPRFPEKATGAPTTPQPFIVVASASKCQLMVTLRHIW